MDNAQWFGLGFVCGCIAIMIPTLLIVKSIIRRELKKVIEEYK